MIPAVIKEKKRQKSFKDCMKYYRMSHCEKQFSTELAVKAFCQPPQQLLKLVWNLCMRKAAATVNYSGSSEIHSWLRKAQQNICKRKQALGGQKGKVSEALVELSLGPGQKAKEASQKLPETELKLPRVKGSKQRVEAPKGFLSYRLSVRKMQKDTKLQSRDVYVRKLNELSLV